MIDYEQMLFKATRGLREENAELKADIKELKKENALLRDDARRYHYIRNNQYWQRFDDCSVIGVKFPYEKDFQCRPMLDHHIDEALNKLK